MDAVPTSEPGTRHPTDALSVVSYDNTHTGQMVPGDTPSECGGSGWNRTTARQSRRVYSAVPFPVGHRPEEGAGFPFRGAAGERANRPLPLV